MARKVTRPKPHLIVAQPAEKYAWGRKGGGGKAKAPVAPPSRRLHGKALLRSLQTAFDVAAAERAATGIVVPDARDGATLDFKGQPGFDLPLSTFDQAKLGIELLSVRTDSSDVQHAAVFVPKRQRKLFEKKFDEYAASAKPGVADADVRHRNIVDRVTEIAVAALEQLWTDDPLTFPAASVTVWWEVWLTVGDGREAERLRDLAPALGLTVAPRAIEFDDRTVVLVTGRREQLAQSMLLLNSIAEVRAASGVRPPTPGLPVELEERLVASLVGRVQPAGRDAPAVCVLDTGVNRDHRLLSAVAGAGRRSQL